MSATVGLKADRRMTGMGGGGEAEDFLRVLMRRYRLVLACCLIGLILAGATVFFVPPRYSARAVMRVDTDDIDTGSLQSTLSSTREVELRRDHQIETQLQLLSSRPLMRRVVRTLALYDDAEFNPSGDVYGKAGPPQGAKGKAPAISPLTIEAVTDRLINVVRIAQDGQTSFLNIDVSSRSAAKAARIANKIVSTYVETQVSEKKASNLRAIQALDRQVSDLRQQLISIERGAASYKREHRLDGTASDDNRAGQIGQLAGALAVARGARAEAEVRAGSGSARDRVDVTSPLLTSLREQETETRRRLAELTTSFGRGLPDVQKAEAQLGEIRRSMNAESVRVQQELQRETAAQRARETQLNHELQTAQSRSLDDVITAVPLADMERNGDATRAVYVGLLGRLDGLVRENELVRPDATIAFAALPPTSRSSPQVARVLVIAVAGSVLLSLILVLIVEQLDTRLRTGEQVQRITGLPVFGMIPQLRRRSVQLNNASAIDQPYSAFTEEVRSICSKVARLLPESLGGVILISSPEPGDGKTTIALALAAAAIATGRSAIVVDLDLRRPELAERLGQAPNEADIVSFLRGEASLDQVIVACPGIPSLKSLSALTAAEDPGALIASRRLRTMMGELRERFDLVIVNTPPVLAVHDAVSLAPLADVVLLVVSWGRTSRTSLRSAASQFEDDVTGVVFNHVDHSVHRRAAYEDYVYDRSHGSRWYRGFGRRRLGRIFTSRALAHRHSDAAAG
jgi:succinoglycan biosynthesis transport protein ExoP